MFCLHVILLRRIEDELKRLGEILLHKTAFAIDLAQPGQSVEVPAAAAAGVGIDFRATKSLEKQDPNKKLESRFNLFQVWHGSSHAMTLASGFGQMLFILLLDRLSRTATSKKGTCFNSKDCQSDFQTDLHQKSPWKVSDFP